MHRKIRQTVRLSLALVVLAGGSPVVGLQHAHCLADRPHRYDEFPVACCPHKVANVSTSHGHDDGHGPRQHVDPQIDVHWHYVWLGIELGEVPLGDDGTPRTPTHERIVATPIAGELMAAESRPLESSRAGAAVCSTSHVVASVDTTRSHLLTTAPADAGSPLCDAARLERTGVRLC